MKISLLTCHTTDRAALRLTARSLAVQQNAPEIEWLTGPLNNDQQMLLSEIFTDAETNPTPIICTDAAVQTLLTQATGDYVWFLPAGTTLADAFVLRDAVQAVARHGATDFFWGDAVDAFGPREAGDLYQLQHGLITPIGAMLFRRKKITPHLPTLLHQTDMITAGYTLAVTLAADDSATKTYLPRLLCEDPEFTVSPANLQSLQTQFFAPNFSSFVHKNLMMPLRDFLHDYAPILARRWRQDQAKKRHVGGKETKGRVKPPYLARRSRQTLSN